MVTVVNIMFYIFYNSKNINLKDFLIKKKPSQKAFAVMSFSN